MLWCPTPVPKLTMDRRTFFPKFIRMIYPYGGVSFIVVPHPSPLLHRSTRHVTQAQAHGSRGGTRLVALARTHAASQKHRTELNQVVSNYLQNEKNQRTICTRKQITTKKKNKLLSGGKQQQPQHQRIMNCEFLISSQTAGRHFNSHIDNKCCTSSEPFESNELKFHHAKGNGTHTRKQTNKHTYQISLGDKPSKTPEAGNCPKGCLLDT